VKQAEIAFDHAQPTKERASVVIPITHNVRHHVYPIADAFVALFFTTGARNIQGPDVTETVERE
jgi:hypothetical protein